MADKINASDAMIKVLEDWGVNHIFGLPGGSFDSTMNALHNRRKTMKYIQVRHEEAGALAAAGEAKFTGKIGVCFGSAGPGAVHLLNGLYDAKHDHAPVLALVAQVPTAKMNTDYFQEINEGPIFDDVAVYNRTVMTAEQLPAVVDQAIRQAYEHSGVAVVIIPKDLGWTPIDDDFRSTAHDFSRGKLCAQPDPKDVAKAVQILNEAERPLIYFGAGAKDAAEELVALSDKMKIPMMSSALGVGVLPEGQKAYVRSAGRVATKPGVDAAFCADAVLFIGTNMPFTSYFVHPNAKFIQVTIKPTDIGKRHHVDLGIVADAKATLKAMLEAAPNVESRPYYDVIVEDLANWNEWSAAREDLEGTPLEPDTVFARINRNAEPDAIFAVDVGNVTIDGYRMLKVSPKQKISTSAWYATMGYALPAAIGAQESYPDRQVFSISGDGGFAMNIQDIMTQVKYHEPIINIVLTNEALGFIEGEQDDINQPHSGVDLIDGDYADACAALGAKGFEVRTLAELDDAFAQAVANHDGPSVIDVKISGVRPLPVEQLVLDVDEHHTQADVDEFARTYRTQGLVPISKLLERHGLDGHIEPLKRFGSV
ncbi:pyruvate oxidase [Bifidobacterium sp. ESL0800]|uniref:pyruvate oxidase n=1 Tax=Bifidobacterium sp. ESL0800 TaxID=2983236 RepID=UPI0023F99488|nr:pyruvate oxidase [Bifidobacterium sp. ESL0800]WEV75546.1 pyruvate oxidase [Bifidobacterium sp. ESL0800]